MFDLALRGQWEWENRSVGREQQQSDMMLCLLAVGRGCSGWLTLTRAVQKF
jgi:hypothetical protein